MKKIIILYITLISISQISYSQSVSLSTLIKMTAYDAVKLDNHLSTWLARDVSDDNVTVSYSNQKTMEIISLVEYQNKITYSTNNSKYYNELLSQIKQKFNIHLVYTMNDGTIAREYRNNNNIDIIIMKGTSNTKNSYHIFITDNTELNNRLKLEKEQAIIDSIENARLDSIQTNYDNIVLSADKLFNQHEYSSAIEHYNIALNVTECDSKNVYIKKQINKSTNMINFLIERETIIYRYDIIPGLDEAVNDAIQLYYKDDINNANLKLDIECIVDFYGKVTINILNYPYVKLMCNNITPIYKHGYSIKVITKLSKYIIIQKLNLDVKLFINEYGRADTYISSDINDIVYNTQNVKTTCDKGLGKYKLNYIYRSIYNDTEDIEFSTIDIIDYKKIGGPVNAISGIIVPGMGLNKVTCGNERGYKYTIPTYSLYIIGVLSYSYSINTYDKYLNSPLGTSQIELNKLHNNAELANKIAISSILIGGIIHTSSIIKVFNEGSKNKKYNTKFSFDYNSRNKTSLISYNLTF